MRRTPRRTKAFRPLVLLLLGSCDGCPQAALPDPPTPDVESVVVRPGTILAEVGATFTLEAVVKGQFGVLLDPSADPDLSVEWADPGSVLADPFANPVTVTVPDDPGGDVQIHATVTDSGTGQSFTSNTVTVTISPPQGSALAMEMDTNLGPSDWALVEHLGSNPPGALLVQAVAGGTPVRDWIVGVVGHVRLGRNFSPPGGSAPSEAAVFARSRYADVRPGHTHAAPWSSASDEVDADPLDYGNLRFVTVKIGVEDDTKTVSGMPVADWVAAEAEAAVDLLERNRAGVELDLAGVFEHGLVNEITGAPRPAEPLADCADPAKYIPTWGAAGDPGGELYILYVPDILLWVGSGSVPEHRTGWACTPSVHGGRHRLVFLSWQEAFPATFTHELGHVLSLAAGYGAGAAGHVNGLPGFDIANVMWSASGLIYGGPRAHLTVGQVYRMNAHQDSWLNLAVPNGWAYARACQTNTGTGICPALRADVGG